MWIEKSPSRFIRVTSGRALPKEAVDDDIHRPKILDEQLREIGSSDAEAEALIAIGDSSYFFKFDDTNAERLDVIYNVFWVNIHVDMADVVVGREIGSFP